MDATRPLPATVAARNSRSDETAQNAAASELKALPQFSRVGEFYSDPVFREILTRALSHQISYQPQERNQFSVFRKIDFRWRLPPHPLNFRQIVAAT